MKKDFISPELKYIYLDSDIMTNSVDAEDINSEVIEGNGDGMLNDDFIFTGE